MTTETLLVGVATAIADTIDLHLPHSTPTHQLPINSIMHVGIRSSNYTSIYLNCVFVHIKWMTNFAYVLHDLYVCVCVCGFCAQCAICSSYYGVSHLFMNINSYHKYEKYIKIHTQKQK